jgi:cytochrome c peroxidase
VQPEEVARDLDAFLSSLQPMPSPHLVNGARSADARRGETLFRSKRGGCTECHAPPLYTKLKSYDVGTRGPLDQPKDKFDVPTLIEVWRSGPYLHDGSATTIRDVLTTRNPKGRHGNATELSSEEIDDLCAYVLSL